mmetsp:Transcript_8599/g.15603  ORF Transcript_8599/g.15603 Transcript_8599/m.15603 type:complete len:210 (+) Transcript_8599:115-744(+)
MVSNIWARVKFLNHVEPVAGRQLRVCAQETMLSANSPQRLQVVVPVEDVAGDHSSIFAVRNELIAPKDGLLDCLLQGYAIFTSDKDLAQQRPKRVTHCPGLLRRTFNNCATNFFHCHVLVDLPRKLRAMKLASNNGHSPHVRGGRVLKAAVSFRGDVKRRPYEDVLLVEATIFGLYSELKVHQDKVSILVHTDIFRLDISMDDALLLKN